MAEQTQLRSSRHLWGVAAAVFTGAAVAVLPAAAASANGVAPDGHSQQVRLNQMQVIGTHNSYHLEPTAREKAIRSAFDPVGEAGLEYSHIPIPDQFDDQAVRQIELDLFADPTGGLYSTPLLRQIAGEGPYDPAMQRPGTKILHIQDVDYHSNCLTLVVCLTQVKQWMGHHSGNVPIAILLEFKDGPITVPGAPTVTPVRWQRQQLLEVDREIRSVFGERDMITPDDVRRRGMTLEQSILTKGWPTLQSARGKVMFLMDNDGRVHDEYVRDNPSLEDRALFTTSNPGQPDAAFLKRNDPLGANTALIRDLVRRGYVVRTRADIPTVQVRTADTTMREAALSSGAQWVSTDYPVRGISARFGTDYFAAIPGGTVARCNPINAPRSCRSATLDQTRTRHGADVT